jgi:hypothetical protein
MTPKHFSTDSTSTTPKVELVYDPDCPNVDRARERLRQAIGERRQVLHWTEWRSDDPALPDYARGHGSPTILIDERDVAPTTPEAGHAASTTKATGPSTPRLQSP